MRILVLFTVSVLGLMQTACEMKVASDNQILSNNSAPFGNLGIPLPSTPVINPMTNPVQVPVTALNLPSGTPAGTTPVGNGLPGGTTPMVPITTTSAQLSLLSDAQKSFAVRSSLVNAFARGPVSTFQNARTPASIPAPIPSPAPKPAVVKTTSESGSMVAVNRESKVEISRDVESAR